MGLRLIFMGTPDFARPALDALHADGHEICAVYTRAAPARVSSVQARADALGIKIFTPAHFNDAATQADFAAHRADLAVVAAYGLILPPAILAMPRYGCWNIHASLLPRWRGAAPIQRAMMAGDSESGISIMQMAAGLDSGAVLARAATPIAPEDTAGALHDRLAELGAATLCNLLAQLLTDTPPPPEPQDEAQATYAAKIDKGEARIDWTQNAEQIARQIRALSPLPGAWCLDMGGARLKILNARTVPNDMGGAAGEIISPAPDIACGDGNAVRLLRLQRAGRAALDAPAFMRGAPLPRGERLS